MKKLSLEQILSIHIRMIKIHKGLELEGKTLYHTLYPFLNQPLNQKKFIQSEIEIFRSMIASINRYLQDNDIQYSSYFIGYLIENNPHFVRELQQLEQHKIAIEEHMRQIGLNEQESKWISQNPKKFIWPGLIEKIQNLCNKSEQLDLISFLSKVQVLSDPILIFDEILDLYRKRDTVFSLLSEKDQINLPLERCMLVLQSLKDMDKQDIIQITQLEEQTWLREITKRQSQSSSKRLEEVKNSDQFQQLYEEQTKTFYHKREVTIEELLEISRKVENICDEYKHNEYQATLAQIIMACSSSTIQCHIPTASGKTWIMSLIAEYWKQQGKSVIIIVPNEVLKLQTLRYLKPLGLNLKIETIQNFYGSKLNHDIAIVDEYDQILSTSPYKVVQNKIFGLWDLTLTQCYLFSATCDAGMQRIIQKTLGQTQILTFKSEVEFLTGIQQDLGGDVEIFKKQAERVDKTISLIEKFGKHIPIIIFCETDTHEKFEKVIKSLGLTNVLKGMSIQNLDEIQQWHSGVLLLSPEECCGYNTRFKQDAKVIISCNVKSESQYQQMRGRSSRTRGILQSIYLTVSNLSKTQIILGMKKLAMQEMDEIEGLMEIIYKKKNTKLLIETLVEASKNQEEVRSLAQLRQILGEKDFKRLM